MTSKPATTPNPTVDSAFAILQLFARVDSPLGVSEIARAIDLPLSTTHRVVSTMVEVGYLQQREPSSDYEPGLEVRELLAALQRRYRIRTAAMPALRRLASMSGWAVVLVVRFGRQGLRVTGVRDRQLVHRPLQIGEVHPLHEMSGGLTLLAFQPPAFLTAYLADEPDAAGVNEVIRQIRRDGHLVRLDHGMHSVAFPVRNPAGTASAAVVLEGAAVSFGAPTERQLKSWARPIETIEALGAKEPELFIDPFESGWSR